MKLYAVALMLLALPLSSQSRADWIVHYTGAPFDLVQGPGFIIGDRVTGSFTFANAGDAHAKSITLSATINGVSTVFFNIPDVNSAPGLTIGSNVFGWVGNLPVAWDVTIFGNVFGNSQDEQISISDAFADLAAVDLGHPTSATIGTNSVKGAFSAVPEPTSTAMFCGIFLLAGSARLRVRWRQSSI